MLHLLNAIDPAQTAFWLLVALGILLIAEVAVFAFAMFRRPRELEPEKPRHITGITLDTSMVRRQYEVGEKFDPAGLIVMAHYSGDPYEERLTDFTVVTPELIEQLESVGKKLEDFQGCLLYAPDLSVEGKPTVTVTYANQIAAYAISVVNSAPKIAPAPVVERKLIGLKLNTDAVRKTFTVGDKFTADGLIVNALYNVEPYTERVSAYSVLPPDLTKSGKALVTVGYQNFAVDYLINVDEIERTLTGISLNTENVRKEYTEGEELDLTGLVVIGNYNVEPLTETIDEGYEIKPVDMSVGTPTVMVCYGGYAVGFQITVNPIEIKPDPIAVAEDSSLRYDRSFAARLIQSDDETKQWYTMLKNCLLSYKKVKDRLSWKRESYNYGREPVVRLGYRGKTLCVYFPLDPNDYLESKYKVEDVTDNSTYADTPCMYRIKNSKRMKYAMELIDVVMQRLNGGVRIERESVDYYVPYEGLVELINKGLIKRTVNSSDSKAFFEQSAAEAEIVEEVAPTENSEEKAE